MADFDISGYEILDKVSDTPAGPVNRIHKEGDEKHYLAFFLERNCDYPEFQEQIQRLKALENVSNILSVVGMSQPDESRGLPMAVITEDAEEGCYASFCYAPKPRMTKLETGIMFFGLANGVRECNTNQLL